MLSVSSFHTFLAANPTLLLLRVYSPHRFCYLQLWRQHLVMNSAAIDLLTFETFLYKALAELKPLGSLLPWRLQGGQCTEICSFSILNKAFEVLLLAD